MFKIPGEIFVRYIFIRNENINYGSCEIYVGYKTKISAHEFWSTRESYDFTNFLE